MQLSLISGLLYLCFLFSGASGLIFEIVWMRKLSLIFGNTVHAVSIVVAVFMGGLALGSWIFGKIADSANRLLRLYIFIELGIAASGLTISLLLIPVLDNAYIFLHGLGLKTSATLFLVRFSLSMLIMLVPTILMGGTLPVIGRYLVRGQSELGARIGTLYGMNTLGAVIGTFSCGFWLIAIFGETGTILIAVSCNLAAGFLAFAAFRAGMRKLAGPVEKDKGFRASIYPESRLDLVPLLYALSGFAAMAYEVLWTRALIYFVGLSVHAFATILTCFLAGIAVGSFIATRFVDRCRPLFLFFGALQWILAFAGVASIPMIGQLNKIYQSLNLWLEANTWSEITMVKFFLCLAILGLPTLAMGAAFPTVNRLFIRRKNSLGRGVGTLYASNTAGTILGSLFAGFLLLPLAGITGSILIVAGINTALAVAVTYLEIEKIRGIRLIPAAGLILILASTGTVYATGGLVPIIRYSLHNLGKEIIYFKEGNEASLAVLRNVDGHRELNINGESTAYTGFDDIVIHKLLSHLPILFHPDPKSELVVGFGFGSTVYTATRYDLPVIECVELVPEEAHTASYFIPENHSVLDSGLVKMVFDDGRNQILTSKGKYDVISFNAIHPKLSPMLYTLDFYRLCARALAPGGTICAWLPANGLTLTEFKSLLRSFVEVFPHSSLWWCNPANFILLGVSEPLEVDFPAYRRSIAVEKIHANLAEVKLDNPLSLASLFIMGEQRLRQLIADAPLNTDSKPVIEFSTTMEPHVPLETYYWMMDNLEPITDYFIWKDVPPKVAADSLAELRARCEKWYRARDNFYRGKFASWTFQEPSVSANLYRQALAMNPEDDYIRYFVEPPLEDPDSLKVLAAANREDFVVRYQLGNYYFTKGETGQAKQWFREVTRIVPEHAQAWFQLGVCADAQGNSIESERYFRRVLEINPANPQAMINLGLTYYRRNNLAEAEKYFKRALQTSPGNGQAMFNLANIRLRQNNAQEAERLFRETVENNPFMSLAYLNLGVMQTRRGDYTEAVENYKQAIELSPGLLPAYRNLALAYQKMGDTTNAEKYHDLARRLEARISGSVNEN